MASLTLFSDNLEAMQHSQTSPILVFDGTYEGWLTAIFMAYDYGWQNLLELAIVTEFDFIPSLWQQRFDVITDGEKAERVSVKLQQSLGKDGMRQLLWAFLSEQPAIYTAIFGMVVYQLAHPNQIVWEHHTHPAVMQVSKLVKMVGRERHRMQAFVRFEHTVEDIYFARINPDFNVLPLIGEHFKNRYADQSWAIYDVVRGYGIFYQKDWQKDNRDDEPLQIISDVSSEILANPSQIHSEQEQHYQWLWRRYFKSVTIKERYNPKLHKQMLPRRYWQYLTEKQGVNSIRFN